MSGKAAWARMGSFWTSNVKLKWRSIVFKGYVLNAVLSGVESLARSNGPLLDSDLAPLESFLARRCRAVLRGVAKPTSAGEIRSLDNLEVLSKFGIAAVMVECRVRRLVWLQSLLRHPVEGAQVLAVVFGDFQAKVGERMVVQPGVLSGPLGTANPWALQWLRDVSALECFDDGLVLLERYDMSAVALITEGREDFIHLDVMGLKSHYWTHRDMYARRRRTRGGGGQYRCCAKMGYGTYCTACFSSQAARTSHYVHMKGGEHGAQILGRIACVSNQCIICGSAFCSYAQAQKHMSNAMLTHECKDRGRSGNVVVPKFHECRLCEFGSEDPVVLRFHILNSHLAPHLDDHIIDFGFVLGEEDLEQQFLRDELVAGDPCRGIRRPTGGQVQQEGGVEGGRHEEVSFSARKSDQNVGVRQCHTDISSERSCSRGGRGHFVQEVHRVGRARGPRSRSRTPRPAGVFESSQRYRQLLESGRLPGRSSQVSGHRESSLGDDGEGDSGGCLDVDQRVRVFPTFDSKVLRLTVCLRGHILVARNVAAAEGLNKLQADAWGGAPTDEAWEKVLQRSPMELPITDTHKMVDLMAVVMQILRAWGGSRKLGRAPRGALAKGLGTK